MALTRPIRVMTGTAKISETKDPKTPAIFASTSFVETLSKRISLKPW
jgi:hypothetical protein